MTPQDKQFALEWIAKAEEMLKAKRAAESQKEEEITPIVLNVNSEEGTDSATPKTETPEEDLENSSETSERDELFEEAARVIVQNQMGSTSLIQRRLKLGYNRAGRLMDQLEKAGIVGENTGAKSREVKFRTETELEQHLNTLPKNEKQETATETVAGPTDYSKLFSDIEEKDGKFIYVTSQGKETQHPTKKEAEQAISFAYETVGQVTAAIKDGTYEKLIADGTVTKEKITRAIEAAGLQVPETIKNALEPKKDQEKKIPEVSAETIAKYEKGVGVRKPKEKVKQWPPEQLLLMPIETPKQEQQKSVEVIVEAEEIRDLLKKGFEKGISSDPKKETTGVTILPFRPNSRTFGFGYTLTSDAGKTSVTGMIRVPTGERKTFEVDIKPDGISSVGGNKIMNTLKNTVLTVSEKFVGDKTEMAKTGSNDVLEVITRVIKEKYGNTVPMIKE